MSILASTVQKAEKEVTINFPIGEVKAAVMQMFTNFPDKYLMRKNDINEVFNTYHFPVVDIIKPGIVDMVLEDVGGEKTKIIMTVTNPHGSSSSNSILAGIANDYLLVLSKVLTGESEENIKETVKSSGSGCMLWLLIGISLVALMSLAFI